jgi:Transposase DDE domain group 1
MYKHRQEATAPLGRVTAAVGIRRLAAKRLCRDPAMRWVVGGKALTNQAASTSQTGRFETKWLARPENLAALADLPGLWIDAVHKRRQPQVIVLDIDSSESPTYGLEEGSAYNGHFGCT